MNQQTPQKDWGPFVEGLFRWSQAMRDAEMSWYGINVPWKSSELCSLPDRYFIAANE